MSTDYLVACKPCRAALMLCSDGFSGPKWQTGPGAAMWFVRQHEAHGPAWVVREQSDHEQAEEWAFVNPPPEEQ